MAKKKTKKFKLTMTVDTGFPSVKHTKTVEVEVNEDEDKDELFDELSNEFLWEKVSVSWEAEEAKD